MEHLVQVILPLRDNQGQALPRSMLDEVRRDLLEHFNGVTAHMRAPAQGDWQAPDGRTERDDVVMFEILCERLDRCWWHDYRRHLEARFEQKEVHVRALPVEKL